MTLQEIKKLLKEYDGDEISIMEVCGSHTGAISKFGIAGMLSERIHLISGPGCPVCVTPTAYIDRLIDIAKNPSYAVVTFGDLIRVPGSVSSLAEAKGQGADVRMVYSPMDMLDFADEEKEKIFVFAAVGFETTTPVYARLIDEALNREILNIRVLTALKTMPAVIEQLMSDGADIDAFLAPGHVSVVSGYNIFKPLAEKYSIPFVVAGFTGERILIAIYDLVKNMGNGIVKNDYPSVVTAEGNTQARALVSKYFRTSNATWRGIGEIKDSGLLLKDEYKSFDMGSEKLVEDKMRNPACRCKDVLSGKIKPFECPLFKTSCSPTHPKGACMVSTEGNCFSYYSSGRTI